MPLYKPGYINLMFEMFDWTLIRDNTFGPFYRERMVHTSWKFLRTVIADPAPYRNQVPILSIDTTLDEFSQNFELDSPNYKIVYISTLDRESGYTGGFNQAERIIKENDCIFAHSDRTIWIISEQKDVVAEVESLVRLMA